MNYISNAIDLMSDKTVVYWGAGRRLNVFLTEFCIASNRLPLPDYICDSTRTIEEESIGGVPVISFDEVKKMKAADTIIVMTAGLLDLQAQVVKSELYYFPMYHCRAFEVYFYLKEHEQQYEHSLSLLHDEHSREVYQQCLTGVMKGAFWDQSLYEPSAYFDNDVVGPLGNNERMVFAGAFNGKHIDRMLLSNPAVKVDAFEPSSRWSAYLRDKFSANNNVNIHNKILWNQYEDLAFLEDEGNGGLDAHVGTGGGDSTVQGVPIDDYIDGPVTHIALDVEGSEQHVLKGAELTIARDRPKLTICLYHSMDDFINIPILINEMSKGDYKLHVKQHSCITAIETVLYAV